MSSVDNHGVDAVVHQRGHALQRVGSDADTGSYAQTAHGVLAGVGVLRDLGYVAVSDESNQMILVIDHGELLDLVLEEYLGGILKIGSRVGGDDVLGGHDLCDGERHILLETKVAVGDDTDQMFLGIDHGDTADAVVVHEFESIAHSLILGDGDGVEDHAGVGAFHLADLTGLGLDRHILVNYADTAFAGDSDCHRCLGDGVHCSRHEGDLKLDVAREARLEFHSIWSHFGICRDKQHVVEGKALLGYLFSLEGHYLANFLSSGDVMKVCSRSGPTETRPTGTPVISSTFSRYFRAFSGRSSYLRTAVMSSFQPGIST